MNVALAILVSILLALAAGALWMACKIGSMPQ